MTDPTEALLNSMSSTDSILVVTGRVVLHRAFLKKMGPKEYQMASIDLYDENGNFTDTGTVFCDSANPTKLTLSFYKGQLSVRLA